MCIRDRPPTMRRSTFLETARANSNTCSAWASLTLGIVIDFKCCSFEALRFYLLPGSTFPLCHCTRWPGGCSPPPPPPASPPPSLPGAPVQEGYFVAKLKTGATFSVAAKAPLCAASSFTESMLWNQGILSEKSTVSWLVIGHLRGKNGGI